MPFSMYPYFGIMEVGAKEEKMKKIIVLVIAILLMMCPNTVYADAMTYDVYVNHVKQPFVGLMDEELILPLKETYDLLGGKYSYDQSFQANVYQFSHCKIEDYMEDDVVYMSGNYLGEVYDIDGIRYGNPDVFDIRGVTMIVDEENHTVKFLTKDYLETILTQETSKLNETAPELVESINTLLSSSMSMTFNVNTTLKSIKTDEPVSASNTYKRTLVTVDGQAYGELKNEKCDVTFNVKLDQNRAVRRVSGFQMRVLDDTLYMMDPTNKKWMQERFDRELDEVSALSLMHENTFFIATLTDYLNKTTLDNGKINYSFKLNQEALESLSESSPYGNVMMAIQEEFRSDTSTYDLSALEVSFVLEGKAIDIIHVEMLVKAKEEKKATEMNIAVDLEFINQGLVEEIIAPIL